MNSYQRPNPVNAPAISRLRAVSGTADQGFLQYLVDGLRGSPQIECLRCHGSGVLSMQGICGQCFGRGHIRIR